MADAPTPDTRPDGFLDIPTRTLTREVKAFKEDLAKRPEGPLPLSDYNRLLDFIARLVEELDRRPTYAHVAQSIALLNRPPEETQT